MNAHVSQGSWPVLVLNADFRPLSYYPLSLWSWQDAIKAVFLDRVNIVAHYDQAVRSPTLEMQLPSVVSLKSFVKPTTHPAFTRFNVFLRDRFACQYCGSPEDLTFDHIIPRSKGGQTTWENVVAACSPCNLRKGNLTPAQSKMFPRQTAFAPTVHQLHRNGRLFPPELSARQLAGLSVLGYGAGSVGASQRALLRVARTPTIAGFAFDERSGLLLQGAREDPSNMRSGRLIEINRPFSRSVIHSLA
ncbi:5-methylcytosine-specific restriction endonuclease McrA [Bradyrhizobium yuanmingense]